MLCSKYLLVILLVHVCAYECVCRSACCVGIVQLQLSCFVVNGSSWVHNGDSRLFARVRQNGTMFLLQCREIMRFLVLPLLDQQQCSTMQHNAAAMWPCANIIITELMLSQMQKCTYACMCVCVVLKCMKNGRFLFPPLFNIIIIYLANYLS